jgi:uncharacterized coiled-coil DUF342 family protein
MVKSTTIKGCWLRSTCIKKPNPDDDCDFDINDEYLQDIAQRKEQIAELEARIQSVPALAENALSIRDFIQPPAETIVEENDGGLIETIVERYAVSNTVDQEEEAQVEIQRVKISEAIEALEKLALYEQQQENGEDDIIRKIQSIRATIMARKHGNTV